MEQHYQRLDELVLRYPELEECRADIRRAAKLLIASFEASGLLLVCGNGGSAADAQHIVGELVKSFVLPRELDAAVAESIIHEYGGDVSPAAGLQGGLPAVALTAHESLTSAWVNDADPELVFAQQVVAYAGVANTLLAISTSGNSATVVHAARVARALGLRRIGLTGHSGGALAELCDAIVRVPRTVTHEVQELHLPVYHCLCLTVEEHFFPPG
jgi:D-sedoheptulose 7-phosphate isomerase